MDRQLVYFIQCASGEIKIGRALDIARRFKEIQGAHPRPLHLWAVTPAWDREASLSSVELGYFQRFSSARLLGEWFRPVPSIWWEIWRLRGWLVHVDGGAAFDLAPLDPKGFIIDESGHCRSVEPQ